MKSTAKRIIKQLLYDKRAIIVMVLGPILLITLMFLLLGKTDYKPTVALEKSIARQVMGSVLEENFENNLAHNNKIEFSVMPENSDAKTYVEDKKADAVITFKGQDINIVMLELVGGKMTIVTDGLKAASNSAAPGNSMTIKYINQISLPAKPSMSPPNVVPKIALQIGTAPSAMENFLKTDKDIDFISLSAEANITKFIQDGNADAVIEFSTDGIKLTMLKMDINLNTKVSDAIAKASKDIKIGKNSDVTIVHGSTDESAFDSLAYYLLGILMFFLIFLFAGISFVRERTTNTLERLMRTPVSSFSVVGGYSLGFGFFAVIQSILIILYSKFVLNTLFMGQWWLAMLIMLLIAIVAVMMGMFVSVISKSEFQVVQAIPILIIPQIFFAGLIPVDMLPYHLNIISYFMPLYYGGIGLKYVMVYGYGLDKVWPYILTLVGIIALLFIANVAVVRKIRRS